MIAVLIVIFLSTMAIGTPIMVALGLSAVAALHSSGRPLAIVVQTVFQSLDSFSLMAIPFFILAGTLMQSGGIAARLVEFATALVGWMRGGLGAVVVMTSMLFSTVSGSSSATAAAVGSTLIPSMQRKGYPKPFAASVTAASGELGAIIPPSIPMIVYALTANVSVASMFIAGILPGILVCISLIITVYVMARIKGFDVVRRVPLRVWFVELAVAFRRAALALMMPVVILGGIYGGLFTPTEASCVAVVYALFIGLFVYRELKLRDLPIVFGRAAVMSSIIMLIVAFAAVFAYILTINQVPQQVAALISNLSDNPLVFLLLVNLFLFFVGMFVEALAAILILAPILAPVAISFGIDPIHFGAIVIVNLAIGMVTPPVGVNLFVVCQIANLRLERMVRYLVVFLAVLVLNVMIITYVPTLSTWHLGN